MYPSDSRFDASRHVPSGFDLGRWQALEQASPDSPPWKLLPHAVKRSSHDRPWPGLVFWHQVGPEGDLYVPPTASHTILVRRAHPTQLLQRQGGVTESSRWQPGQAVVVPAGLPSFWRSALPRDNLHMDLSPAWLERVAHEPVALKSCFGRDDPLLAGFAQLLLASLDSNTSLDSQFGQHMAEAIALHLVLDKGVTLPVSTKGKGPAFSIYASLLATEDFITRYPAVTTRLVKQLVRASQWASDEANRAALLQLWGDQSGQGEAVYKAEFDGESLKSRHSPRIDEAAVSVYKSVVADGLKLGLIKQNVDVDAWVAPQFVEAALKELKAEKFWPALDRNGRPLP